MIIKQLDESDVRGCPPALVGFIEATDSMRGSEAHPWTEQRYTAAVYQRPVTPSSSALASCSHEHKSIGAAERCLRRLLRTTGGAR